MFSQNSNTNPRQAVFSAQNFMLTRRGDGFCKNAKIFVSLAGGGMGYYVG